MRTRKRRLAAGARRLRPQSAPSAHNGKGAKRSRRGFASMFRISRRLQAGAGPVVFLHVMLESAEQERCAQHEQHVGDNRPAMDAFTSVYCPARNAASAMTSSVRFPSVALSRPPTVSPVLAATGSVAWLSSAASVTIARTDSIKRSVCFGLDLVSGEHHGHEGQQPEQGIATDFFKQEVHAGSRRQRYVRLWSVRPDDHTL
jgi:hypothetical protein